MTSIRRNKIAFLSASIVVAMCVPFIAGAQAVEGGCGTGNGGEYPPGCTGSTASAADTNSTATMSYTGETLFQRNGVFGCSLNGSYSMSVGAMSAIGGVYVPVNDAAVTLNTGYLVYKECVLRGIVNRQRELATAINQKGVLTQYAQGRDGRPYYSENLARERQLELDRVVALNMDNGTLSSLAKPLQEPVKRAILQGYMNSRNNANPSYRCSYTGDLNALYKGKPSGNVFSGLNAFTQPGCDPIIAYTLANEHYLSTAENAYQDMLTRLQWSQGNYDVSEIDEYGNRIARTPGSVVGANAIQALQTGYKQLENANDIDQIVGSLFSGITQQVLKDTQGLYGLTQKIGTQPSYLDRIVTDAQTGLRSAAVNAALQNLAVHLENAPKYRAYIKSIYDYAMLALARLTAYENACWTNIIAKACASAPGANRQCTEKVTCTTTKDENGNDVQNCPTGATLTVSTSTFAFAKRSDTPYQVLKDMASSSADTIARVDTITAAINELVKALTGSSQAAQLAAIKEADRLSATPGALITRAKAEEGKAALDQAITQIGTASGENSEGNLIKSMLQRWGDTTDTKTSWCNFNRAEVITEWKKCWSAGSTSCLWSS